MDISPAAVCLVISLLGATPAWQPVAQPRDIDAKVSRFLDERRGTWRDLNVPEADGRALYDLVLSRRFTRALEIGTSTGYSGIWISWALAKTGGKLTTIEIDEERWREAVANFKQAGLAPFVDARLADAHELVSKLTGPFDFVFIDADKDWYTKYAEAVLPKLVPGGCLTAHNVSTGRWWGGMTGNFYQYIKSLPDMDTTFSAGVMVSCKRKPGQTR